MIQYSRKQIFRKHTIYAEVTESRISTFCISVCLNKLTTSKIQKLIPKSPNHHEFLLRKRQSKKKKEQTHHTNRNRKTPRADQPDKTPFRKTKQKRKLKKQTLGLRSAWNLYFQSLKYGNEAVEWPSSVEQSEEWDDEWPTVARGEESIPGNLWDSSGDQREMGSSMPPPRHWRRKANMARERGRRVRRRRSFAVKECWVAAEDGGCGRRPAIATQGWARGGNFL